ncbi:Syringolide-induced protein 14-1-1 [Quillaja saponaria]|uniref:Syringolide-induced protein 14-1-1 n=1 Tax=Quillaja saponaria TaxID=32244 RepID=A0AAD7KQD7_QUISA|nr:Syringolide-induced protein 14-1-1 [Quillaja saponaria]
MEKLSKLKIRISKLLPQTVAAVTFQGPPPSPRNGRVSRLSTTTAKISIIPSEARRRPEGSSFDAREPTSPKVSCIGQVKHKKKKKMKKKKKASKHNRVELEQPATESVQNDEQKKKKQFTVLEDQKKLPLPDQRIPSLGKLMRFSSGRAGALSNFDFTVAER